MQRMFGAIWRDLSFRPVSRPYPFEDIKKSLTDCKCRVYSDDKRHDSCDDCSGLPSTASTGVSQGNGQIMNPPLDIFVVVQAYKPAFQMDVLGGEVSAG